MRESANESSSILIVMQKKSAPPVPVVQNDFLSPAESTADPVVLLHRLKTCLETGDCHIDESDSRSNHFAVVDRLSSILKTLGESENLTTSAVEAGREFFLVADDYVRSAALGIFRRLPPSSENLSVLISGLQDSQSAGLYSEVLKELTRYQTPAEVQDVDHFLIATIKTGPVIASEKVSEEIFAFIRDDNYESYMELAQSLPPQSIKAQNLKRALNEYQKLRSGG